MIGVRRLGSTAALLVLAAACASSALGVSPPIRFRPISGPIPTAGTQNTKTALTVTVSSHRLGAKPVTVTVRYTGPLRCGKPGGATIELPAAVGVGAEDARRRERQAGHRDEAGPLAEGRSAVLGGDLRLDHDRLDHVPGRRPDEPDEGGHLRAARRDRYFELPRNLLGRLVRDRAAAGFGCVALLIGAVARAHERA